MSWLGWSLELRGNHITQPLMLRLRQVWAVGLGSVARVQSSPKSHTSHVQGDPGAGLEAQWWTS